MRLRSRILACLGAVLVCATAPASAAPPAIPVVPVSQDPLTGGGAQHATEVESETASVGSTVVGVYQVGRFNSGGSAAAAGFATSIDAGQHWSTGLLPGITTATTSPGTHPRVVDMNVAYDEVHAKWLISSVPVDCSPSCKEAAVLVSRSDDGVSWLAPVTAASSANPDKQWTTCDNGNVVQTAYRGNCYVAYTESSGPGLGKIRLVRSTDGGATWSAPVDTGIAAGYNAQPVVTPDGKLTIVTTDLNELNVLAVRSDDGGATFGTPTTVSDIKKHRPIGVRAYSKPSVDVDNSGRIWAAWADCRFRSGCAINDIVTTTSTDGVNWTSLTRVPIDPLTSHTDHQTPALAIDPQSSAGAVRVGIKYFELPNSPCTRASCQVQSAFVTTADGGASWSSRTPLGPGPAPVSYFPQATLPPPSDGNPVGRMPGDYESVSYAGGIAVALFPIARTPPNATTFDVSMNAGLVPPLGANSPPSAVFTSSCNVHSCSFDAGPSDDPDGTIDDYAWNFGDGRTGSGSTPPVHVFTVAGTYPVTLTTTDNTGATTTSQQDVVVSDPAPPPTTTPPKPATRPALKVVLTSTKRKPPYTFTVSGSLKLAAGTDPAKACKGGRISVTFKAGSKTIATRRVTLDSKCRFKSRTVFRTRSRFGKARKLKVTVRFLGTTTLLATSKGPLSIKIR
jgi:hypothetical protein